MFQSTLLRRTMVLVLGALTMAMLMSSLAFLMAGRMTTMDMDIQSALQQESVYSRIFEMDPEFLDDDNYRSYFFSVTANAGRDYYLFAEDKTILMSTGNDLINLSSANTDLAINYFKDSNLENFSEGLNYQTIDSDHWNSKILIIVQKVKYNSTDVYLVSFSVIDVYNDVVMEFLNILLLSTMLAAMAMLVPTYILVRKIVLPIQQINDVATEYARGNLSVRADESHKGEVGELGTSFNNLADKLSKSINDLTTEKNRLQDIFDVISDGIVVVDKDANPIITNKALHTLFDRAEINNLFTERLQLIPFDEVWDDIEDTIETHESHSRTITDRDYAYQVTVIPKFDGDECVGATAFMRDIFNEQRNEQFRRDYIANISHELRTPLQTLRGLIEPLSDGMVKKEEDKQRYYGIILDETMRLSRLIDDMLELSKLQSGTMAFQTYPFDLNDLIDDLEIKMRPIIENAGIEFSVVYNSGKVPTVMGNPDRVEQILIILLDNAKKYTPAGKSISIITDYIESEGKVYISVADTGQGIHEYDINNIFDRFFKADRARGKKGTGLGLAIAKELLTYMGQDIKVTSKYGEGSTFTFTLSKAQANDNW